MNAGKTATSIDALETLVDNALNFDPDAICLFISELDAHRVIDNAPADASDRVYRHWPGPGSWSMAFYIFPDKGLELTGIWWRGRVGGALFSTHANVCQQFKLFVIGGHRPHVDPEEFMLDLRTIIALAPREALVVGVGDWNADLLQPLLLQPGTQDFEGMCFNDLKHKAFKAFEDDINDWGFHITIPSPSATKAGGRFGDASIALPISRRPDGSLEASTQATGLDYGWARPGTIQSSPRTS